MRENYHHTSPLIAGVLLLFALALTGCAGAVVGVGTAAVAASTTEKGFSTSVSDGVIFAKLKDRFIQQNDRGGQRARACLWCFLFCFPFKHCCFYNGFTYPIQ